MRILQVNKFLYRRGGAEAYMLDLAELQRARGHDVEFMSMSHPDNVPATYASDFAPRIELDPPPRRVTRRLAVAADIVWSRRARRSMATIVDDFQPDVVHLHNVYHQLSPSILRELARRQIPTVMTLHDYKLVCPTYQLLANGEICEACVGRHFHNAVRRRCNGGSLAGSALVAGELALHTAFGAYDPIDVFICPSQFLLSKMRAGRVFPDRLQHLPHFADLDGVAAGDGRGEGVVVAGRLSAEKGIDVAIHAIAAVPGASLTIAGDGPERQRLERLAADVAPGRVRFTGRLATPALHDLIRSSRAVLVPSRWYENQPMIVLEAFACGRPVIASDLGGLPELVDDGVSGLLVTHDRPDLLAAAIERLYAEPALAEGMGRRGRTRALRDFSIEAHLDGLDRLYALAAERHPDRAAAVAAMTAR